MVRSRTLSASRRRSSTPRSWRGSTSTTSRRRTTRGSPRWSSAELRATGRRARTGARRRSAWSALLKDRATTMLELAEAAMSSTAAPDRRGTARRAPHPEAARRRCAARGRAWQALEWERPAIWRAVKRRWPRARPEDAEDRDAAARDGHRADADPVDRRHARADRPGGGAGAPADTISTPLSARNALQRRPCRYNSRLSVGV